AALRCRSLRSPYALVLRGKAIPGQHPMPPGSTGSSRRPAKYPAHRARLIDVRRHVMKTIKTASLRGFGLALFLAGIAVLGGGCIAAPGPGYGYEGGPALALPLPAPPVVVAPVPVPAYRGWRHSRWGYDHYRWGYHY